MISSENGLMIKASESSGPFVRMRTKSNPKMHIRNVRVSLK